MPLYKMHAQSKMDLDDVPSELKRWKLQLKNLATRFKTVIQVFLIKILLQFNTV